MAQAAQAVIQAGAAANEQLFLNEGNVLVTSTRFAVPGQTYAIANVSSVATRDFKFPGGAVLLILLGIFTAIYGVGVVLLAIGIWWGVHVKGKAAVVLHTSGGEIQALVGKKAFIARVTAALTNAIISRG